MGKQGIEVSVPASIEGVPCGDAVVNIAGFGSHIIPAGGSQRFFRNDGELPQVHCEGPAIISVRECRADDAPDKTPPQ